MIDLMPKGTVLESVRWEGEPTTCVAVNFPATCIRDLTDARDLGLDPERGPQFCLVDAHVVDLARRLQANANGSEELGAVYVQSLSLALISYVSAKYGRSKTPPEEDGCGFPAQQRQELAAFIDDHLSTNFGLVDLAALVAYSPDHFSRLFKRSFGLPPHKYVSTRRVERAKAMLIDGSAQIAAIASACGFSSQAHLCDVFKRHTGITPGAYRRG
jgi:AraC family transcriptional regulator